jgi:hypothetical protein
MYRSRDARRLEVVERKASDDRAEVGLQRTDLIRLRVVVAQIRFLDDILGLAGAAQHPVSDREEQWTVGLKLFHVVGELKRET